MALSYEKTSYEKTSYEKTSYEKRVTKNLATHNCMTQTEIASKLILPNHTVWKLFDVRFRVTSENSFWRTEKRFEDR